MEIQRKVTKQGERNVISRHVHAKNDKEKIAAWKLDLSRILQVFNVRSIISVWRLLTLGPQTELAINTNATVSNTHIMVSGIHRTVVQGHEGSCSKDFSVSDGCNLAVTGRLMATHRRVDLNQVRNLNHRRTNHLMLESSIPGESHLCHQGHSSDATN